MSRRINSNGAPIDKERALEQLAISVPSAGESQDLVGTRRTPPRAAASSQQSRLEDGYWCPLTLCGGCSPRLALRTTTHKRERPGIRDRAPQIQLCCVCLEAITLALAGSEVLAEQGTTQKLIPICLRRVKAQLPSPALYKGAKWELDGWRAALRMTIAIQVFQFATRMTARCWFTAMLAAIRKGSSPRCGRVVYGRRMVRADCCARRLTLLSSASRTSAARAALALWQSAMAADGTLVETYLASRGLNLPVPNTLRFHAGLKHPSGGIWPAMVALVTEGADGTPLAIHRTFLARDGSGKAPVDPQKMMLGPCRGGAVRLAPAGRRADGRRRHRDMPRRHAGDRPSGLGGAFDLGPRALDLPDDVRDVIVLADGDEPARRRRATARGAGSAKGVACASPARRRGWISTICLWSRTRIEEGARMTAPTMSSRR